MLLVRFAIIEVIGVRHCRFYGSLTLPARINSLHASLRFYQPRQDLILSRAAIVDIRFMDDRSSTKMPVFWRVAYNLRWWSAGIWSAFAFLLFAALAFDAVSLDKSSGIRTLGSLPGTVFDIHYSERVNTSIISTVVLILIAGGFAWLLGAGTKRIDPRKRCAWIAVGSAVWMLSMTGAFLGAVFHWADHDSIVSGNDHWPYRPVMNIEAAIGFYWVQHNGKYPTTERLWDQLTNRTDEDGTIDPIDGEFGPYITYVPINPHFNSNTVAADDSAAWQYDEKTGAFRIIVPIHVIASYGTDFDERVIGVGPDPRTPAQKRQEAVDEMVSRNKRRAESVIHGLFVYYVMPVILILVVIGCFRFHTSPSCWAGKAFSPQLWPVVLVAVPACTGLLYVVVPMGGNSLTLFGLVFALGSLWSFGAFVKLQFECKRCYELILGDFCIECHYDLRGSLAAPKPAMSCPECGTAIAA